MPHLYNHVHELCISELFLHFDLVALTETRLNLTISVDLIKLMAIISSEMTGLTKVEVFACTFDVLLTTSYI